MPVPAWQKGVGALGLGYAGWKLLDGKLNLTSDLDFVRRAGPVMGKLQRKIGSPGYGIVKMWYDTLAETPANKTMLVLAADGSTMTFGDVEAMSNRVAHWAISKGLKCGDVVSLDLENCMEYFPIWLGLGKVGIPTAMINTSIKGKPLVHAITTANCVASIFGVEHAEAVAGVAADLRSAGVRHIASFGGSIPDADGSLSDALSSFPGTPVDEALRKGVKASDPVIFIYTSGTTGLPKACVIPAPRLALMTALPQMLNCGADDIIYGSGLPLYHSAANLGLVHAVQRGATYIIRKKFTATQQWEDCAKYGATAMQYIGELCRYLLAVPPGKFDQAHKLRIAFGNGLRPEIWDEFQKRFNIPEIGEFYGATEGNGALLNYCRNYEGQGAVGRAGALANLVLPMSIVKFDVENEVPVRDPATGFCIRCDFNEPGELIVPIKKLKTADGELEDFQGYTNKEATDKKLLMDVFKKGDKYFRTGDLLRKDSKGYFYFVDRIGDTFRWKGENVSTMEVSEIVSAFPGIVDANIYGVEVPGKDGRACMAAITLKVGEELDAVNFSTYCRGNLPLYSVPLFIRFLEEDINLTGTLKHQKVEYRSQGCDPSKIKDKMWWFDISKGQYAPYGHEQFASITQGQSKL